MAQNDGSDCVIVTRFSALGDVAMTIPVVYSACISHPATKFVMLTRKHMASMFVEAPSNLTVIGIDFKSQNNPLFPIILARKIIADYKPTAWVDLHDVLRSKLMRLCARMHGLRIGRIDKGRSEKRKLTRRRNKVMLPLRTSIERYKQAFFDAGIPVEMKWKGLFINSVPLPGCNVGVRKEGETWIGIAPFAAHAGKIYPLDKMRQVVEMLSSRKGYRLFIFGGSGEEAQTAQQWARDFDAVTSIAGKKNGFPAELALLRHLDAILTMDSANMHLASLVGTPTVSVWGATHPFCGFMGWNQREDSMAQLPLNCRPCSVFGDKPCLRGDLLCLNGIAPQHIVAKIDSVLSEKKRQ